MAVHGANLEALTGDEVFRIPLARCSLEREGQKILVRDEQASLVIWSDDEGFLDALERAQRGTLKDQVRRIRRAERLRRLLKSCGFALIAAGIACAASAPVTRWAVRGGVPSIADWIGESALERLALPSGLAPTAERELGTIAERLRPATLPSTRSFRLLLADYAEVHSFSVPPDAVIVTSGLVCDAEGPDLLMAVVARELAHLESHDVSQRVAEAVDWETPLDLVRGDVSKLRARMLDFADPRRSPGFTREQEAAANERANAMLTRAGVALSVEQNLAALAARTKSLEREASEYAKDGRVTAPPRAAVEGEALGWSKVRAEACDLIGR